MCYPCTKCNKCGKYSIDAETLARSVARVCRKCGGAIDRATGKCSECGAQVMAPPPPGMPLH